MSTQPPNCWRCRHLGVSYDARRPYWCRLMDLQSALMPCIEVLRADGVPCRGFTPKPAPATARPVRQGA